MLPDRVSNPGPLTYESGAQLRYAAGLTRKNMGCRTIRNLQSNNDTDILAF